MLLPSRTLTAPHRRGKILGTNVTPIDALTAAATRASRGKAGDMRRLVQPWQARALSYYDLVGECWNAAQFYSRSMKQVRLYAATRDDDGELSEDVPDEVKAEVARIQDPGGGGYSRLMDSYGRLKFMIGEGYFLVTSTLDGDEAWEFVSPDELRLTNDGIYTRFAAPSLPAEELRDVPDTAYQPLPGEALVYRVWRPHPRYSKWADSPIRAVLDILEELVLLTLAVRGTAKSRLVRNGILYIPDEISPAPLEAVGDEDMALDPFLDRLQEQLLAGIVNPGTAAAVAPALMRGPAEYADRIKWIQVSNPLETYPEEGLRTEAIRRFASGVEMPAEILLGTADVNHWGAWLIDEQAAKNYIFPACQDLCDDLTAVFLRPTLRAGGVTNWDQYVIAYDAAAVVAKPDRTGAYKDAHDRLVISDASYREAIDASDDDAPDQAEWDRRAAVKMNDPDALTIPYSAGGPERADDQEDGEVGGPETGTDPPPGERGTPPRPDEPPADQLANRRFVVLGACITAIERARELAGSRLRATVRSTEPDKFTASLTGAEELASVENTMLARALGPDFVRERHGGELSLVAGSTGPMLAALRSVNVNGDTGHRLAAMVEQHAARTLYHPAKRELPPAIASFIERVIR